MKRAIILILLAAVFLTGFPAPLYCEPSSAPRIVDLVRNGGFEEPVGWNAYHVGDPFSSRVIFDTTTAHGGAYSARIQSRGGSPSSPELTTGVSIRQVITREDLNFDLMYVFWMHPNVRGEVKSPPYTWIRSWVLLGVEQPSKEMKFAKLVYHMAWGGLPPSDSADTVNFFVDCETGRWNRVERNVKRDFEDKFGPTSKFSLKGIELGFELLRQGLVSEVGMPDSVVFFDDVSLQMLLPVVKASSSISCSVPLSKVKEGESISISGFLSPARGGVPITLTYKKPDGSTLTKFITTSPEGKFADTYVPDMAGDWNLFASWGGDEGYLATTSPPAPFTVEAKPKPLIEQTNLALLGIIIAIIIALAAIVLMKRRRKRAHPKRDQRKRRL